LGNDGYCLVNGTRFQFHGSYPQAGYMYAQDYPSTSSAGYHDTEQIVINEYSAGTDPRWWPFVFFIGGAVTRNPDGSIAAIARVTLPFNRLQELHRMILRIKPLHAWAAMCVRYA
jgi:hypothetical protein